MDRLKDIAHLYHFNTKEMFHSTSTINNVHIYIYKIFDYLLFKSSLIDFYASANQPVKLNDSRNVKRFQIHYSTLLFYILAL